MTNGEARRPKIFCQFVDFPGIGKTAGDRINEIRFYRSLSTFADVYYNDVLIDWSKDFIGVEGERGDLNEPSRDYDLYYVRANPDLFKRLPHPKVTLAYPYSEEIFEAADALFSTTGAWSDMLRVYNDSEESQTKLGKWYPEQIQPPKAVVNIRQTIDPIFLDEPPERARFNWRVKTTMAKNVFGFFGRVTDETIPQRLVTSVDRARERMGDKTEAIVAFAGSIRTKLPGYTLNLGRADYHEMPALLSACRATLGQECPDSGFLGSGKTLDSVACGVPVISERNPVRIEQLGADYKGLFDTQEEADHLIHEVCANDAFYQELVADLMIRREMLLPPAIGAHIHQAIKDAGLLS